MSFSQLNITVANILIRHFRKLLKIAIIYSFQEPSCCNPVPVYLITTQSSKITTYFYLLLHFQLCKNWILLTKVFHLASFHVQTFDQIGQQNFNTLPFPLHYLDLVSLDGAFRVVSDDFSISLLNPVSEEYQLKADKYQDMVSSRSLYLHY